MKYFTDGSREEFAPDYDNQTTAFKSVILRPDEEVEWTFCYGLDGKRIVTGYTIKKKTQNS